MRTIVIALCLLGSQATFAQGVEPADIPQANVAAVLESLRANPSAQFGEQRGWTVVASSEHGLPVQWFFTPEGHPAHPAVVKRTALESDGVGRIDLAALCQVEEAACAQLLDDFRQQHELAQAAARPERVTLDVTIALDDHERLRVERLLAEEGMAAEIRFTDVLKVVIVPTLGDDGRVLLWTAVYEFDGADYVPLGDPQLASPGSGTARLEMASTSGSRFGFSLASLVAHTAE
ncbi:MAG TPA: hypothetical protein VFL30_13395 [Rhodanobacteraceae bacterium]|nr:hypothetical protein [Rhodanobacteraceae bacterium]